MPNIDPETFRGKLYLLVLDKVVIGALIAIAFLVYDQWKTQEIRRYASAQEETQLGFRRAEYVRQLVPIVLDSKQDILYRAHSLGALVETKSIDANSAVNFAQKLLDSNVLGSEEYTKDDQNVPRFIHRSPTGEDYFLATMLKTMPSGLPALLNEYRQNLLRLTGQEREVPRVLNDAAGFWRRLFRETIRRHRDSELDLLDSDEFLVNNLDALHTIVPEFLTRGEADELAKRGVKGLRILGSIRLLRSSREANAHAVMQLRSVADPASRDRYALELAAKIIERLPKDHLLCASLSSQLLAIVLRREDMALHRKQLGDERSPVEDRFHAATEYLVWCAGFPKDAPQLEPTVLPVIREFYEQLKRTPVGSPLGLNYPMSEMFRLNYPIEWALIRILMKANSGPNRAPGSEAERLLSDIFSLPEEKLVQGGLHHFAREWKKGQIRMVELVGVWKDADGYFEFKPDGTFGYAVTRSALSAGRLDAEGTFRLEGDAFTFESDKVCGKQKGVYRLQTKTEGKLTFTPVKEDCRQRRLVSLERIP